MTTSFTSHDRAAYAVACAFIALRSLKDSGEAVGNFLVPDEEYEKALSFATAYRERGGEAITQDELREVIDFLGREHGIAVGLTTKGRAAAEYDLLTKGAGHG